MKLLAVAFTAYLFVIPILGLSQTTRYDAVRAFPVTPAPIKNILAARPFTLETPYAYTWSKERIMVSTGVLIVLEVDPTYVVPRNTLEPVLYAGNVPVQRLNHGNVSGRVIGIVPGSLDLASTLIWFGSPDLPERITANTVESERIRAERAGIRAFPETTIASVLHPPVVAKDLAALLRDIGAELILEYSPQEKELAESWRLPTAKAPPKNKSD
ncbi:hypothetical protein [Nitrosomonas communis]|jgi:hypothetical protein|uniref:Uncharacterized protein n=1 Tax=Nitrosomonas communis TaxID=44574 RepID=A0A1I4IP51_9PROT|nr:hypothetical protein [Nitrosomonas communis]SFL56189.1 hypothetical protein SAMN05421863_10016 [Nitrosomonas communis]